MLTPDDLDPDRVLAVLRPHLNLLWHALEDGAGEAQEYLERFPADTGRQICPYTFPVLVRLHAKRRLAVDFAGSVKDDDDASVENLPSNGLHLKVGPYSLRVRMSDGGLLPVPGTSRVLRSFYNQDNQLAEPDLFGGTLNIFELRLMVLWDRDISGVLELTLVCPRSGGKSRGDVSEHWRRTIPHPAFALPRTPDTIDVTTEEDLAIYDTPLAVETADSTGSAQQT
jgi:hypothetical protein